MWSLWVQVKTQHYKDPYPVYGICFFWRLGSISGLRVTRVTPSTVNQRPAMAPKFRIRVMQKLGQTLFGQNSPGPEPTKRARAQTPEQSPNPPPKPAQPPPAPAQPIFQPQPPAHPSPRRQAAPNSISGSKTQNSAETLLSNLIGTPTPNSFCKP